MYRSKEELYFSWWLDELKEADYINSWEYEPKSFTLIDKVKYGWSKQLKTKEKHMESTLLNDLCYTPDFRIQWSHKGCNSPFVWQYKSKRSHAFSILIGEVSYIDVKGTFDRNKSNSTFSIIQKVMYDKRGILVEKVVPQKLFEKTFTPKRYLLTDGGGQARKIKWKVKSLEEYLDNEKC
jgi:hypothetical protein